MRWGRAYLLAKNPLLSFCRVAVLASTAGTALLAIVLTAPPALAQATSAPSTPGTATASRTFMIRGSLRFSSSNAPAEMIKVEIKKITGETVNVAFTRSNGDFDFGGLSSGNYILVVEEEGFEPIREQVELRNTTRMGVYLYLREPVKFGTKAQADPTVSARELALSSKASGTLQRGKEELFARKNPEGSLKHFQKLVKEAPDFYEADFYIGLALLQLSRLDEAEASLRRAIAGSQETHAPSYRTLASVLCNLGRFQDAEAIARKGAELDPDVWQVHFEMARALNGMGRPDDALKAAMIAYGKSPDLPDVQLLLANIHIRRGDPYGLLNALDGYLKLRPEGPISDQARETRRQLLEDMRRARGGQQATPPPPPR